MTTRVAAPIEAAWRWVESIVAQVWSVMFSINEPIAIILAGTITGVFALCSVRMGFKSVRDQIRANERAAQIQREHEVKRQALFDFIDAHASRFTSALPTARISIEEAQEIHRRVEASSANVLLTASDETIGAMQEYIAAVTKLSMKSSIHRARARGMEALVGQLGEQREREAALLRSIELQLKTENPSPEKARDLGRQFRRHLDHLAELRYRESENRITLLGLDREARKAISQNLEEISEVYRKAVKAARIELGLSIEGWNAVEQRIADQRESSERLQAQHSDEWSEILKQQLELHKKDLDETREAFAGNPQPPAGGKR